MYTCVELNGNVRKFTRDLCAVVYSYKIVETVFQSTSRFVIKIVSFFSYFFCFLFNCLFFFFLLFLSWITENFLCTLPMLCLHKRLIIKQTGGIVTRVFLKVSHENPEMWLKNASMLGWMVVGCGECRGNWVTCSCAHDNYFEIFSSRQPFGR